MRLEHVERQQSQQPCVQPSLKGQCQHPSEHSLSSLCTFTVEKDERHFLNCSGEALLALLHDVCTAPVCLACCRDQPWALCWAHQSQCSAILIQKLKENNIASWELLVLPSKKPSAFLHCIPHHYSCNQTSSQVLTSCWLLQQLDK